MGSVRKEDKTFCFFVLLTHLLTPLFDNLYFIIRHRVVEVNVI